MTGLKLQFQITAVELSFWGFDFIPTVWVYNVPPYLKIIFKIGLLTSGLVSMLKHAPAAVFKPLRLQSSSLPKIIDSNSRLLRCMQLTLTRCVWHIFLCSIVTQRFGSPRLSSRFWRNTASGHSVCTCNPSQASLLSKCPCSSCLYPTFSTTCSSYSYPSCLYSKSCFTFLFLLLRASPELLLCILFQLLLTVFSPLNLNVLLLPISFHAPGSPKGADQAACCLQWLCSSAQRLNYEKLLSFGSRHS